MSLYSNDSGKILIIDLSSVLHILKHAQKNVKTNELPSYIIHSFLFRLQYLVKQNRPDTIVFAVDSYSEMSKRRKIFPDYKRKRREEKKPEQIALDKIAYPQFSEIEKKILPKIGYVNIFKAPGLEADDVIASVCKDYKDNEIVIVTTDQDLYQLLTDTTCILNAQTAKFFTKADFKKKYGIDPIQWKKVKCFGCSTDGVPGLPGVGEKTIIKYLKGELKPHLQTYQKIKDPANYDLIMRNKKLVVLPFKGTPHFRINFENRATKKGLKFIGEKYNFMPLKKDFDYWYKVLGGRR